MLTLKRITTKVIGNTLDGITVGAKVVVDSVRVVADSLCRWPYPQGMRAYAMQPVRLRSAHERSPSSSERLHRPWNCACFSARFTGWPAFAAYRGAAPIAAS